MDSTKKYISARIPYLLYLSLKKRAEERKVSFTDIVVEAFEQYIGEDIVGLCPKCHTQNPPDAKYCSECSTGLVPDAYSISFSTSVVPSISAEVSKEDILSAIEEIKERMNDIDELVKKMNEKKAKKKMEEEQSDH